MGAVAIALSGCGVVRKKTAVVSSSDMNCLTRAMYFESHQSSRDGLVAVGSVVMNRVASPDFPNTVCGVVTQRNQFASGVMTKDMNPRNLPLVQEAAAAVLAGERHPGIGNARFFHVASYRAGYDNMHYVVTTGGNAFYEKRSPELVTQPVPVAATEGITG
nr:cell wall hydrolase [Maritimibacter sp. DP1N21-5]